MVVGKFQSLKGEIADSVELSDVELEFLLSVKTIVEKPKSLRAEDMYQGWYKPLDISTPS